MLDLVEGAVNGALTDGGYGFPRAAGGDASSTPCAAPHVTAWLGAVLVARGSTVVVLADGDPPSESFRAAVLGEMGEGRCRVGVGGAGERPADGQRAGGLPEHAEVPAPTHPRRVRSRPRGSGRRLQRGAGGRAWHIRRALQHE
jgi:hypothetical protein